MTIALTDIWESGTTALGRYFAAATGAEPARPATHAQSISLLAFHAVGLSLLLRSVGRPLWLALPALAALVAASAVASRLGRRPFSLAPATPLFLLYAMIVARIAYMRLAGPPPAFDPWRPPQLASGLLQVRPWVLAVGACSSTLYLRQALGRARVSALAVAGVFLLLASFAWAAAVYVGQRASGATASDPYAYLQMGVDIARHGSPLHRFPLYPIIEALRLPTGPALHVGYRGPVSASGDAGAVWPVGGSYAIGLAYLIAGEAGAYLVNPIVSLLTLAATALLSLELSRDRSRVVRLWIAAASVFLMATARPLLEWASVPMVDSQAALFSTLAVYCCLRFGREPKLSLALLGGLALGVAYFVRHTQLLVAPAMLVAILLAKQSPSTKLRGTVAVVVGAMPLGLADLAYHRMAFGGFFALESNELALFSIGAVVSTCISLGRSVLASHEFGWVWPFVLVGAFWLARRDRRALATIAVWVLVVVGFHLPYVALRTRDLLPEYVPVAVLAAYGFLALAERLWRGAGARRTLFATAVTGVLVFLVVLRGFDSYLLPLGEPIPIFGRVDAPQRLAFAQIAALTPPGAVVGSTLNTGPIDLYSGRETFTLYFDLWNQQQLDTFVSAMLCDNRSVYILNDGAGTDTALKSLVSHYALREVAHLDVPLHGPTSSPGGTLWQVSQVGVG